VEAGAVKKVSSIAMQGHQFGAGKECEIIIRDSDGLELLTQQTSQQITKVR
jgi:hypothetical protein